MNLYDLSLIFLDKDCSVFNINNIFLKVFKDRCNIKNKKITLLNSISKKLISVPQTQLSSIIKKNIISFLVFSTSNIEECAVQTHRWNIIIIKPNMNNYILFKCLKCFDYVDDIIGGYNISKKKILNKLKII